MKCGLEKLGLVDQNWFGRDFFALLVRTLTVGKAIPIRVDRGCSRYGVRKFDELF